VFTSNRHPSGFGRRQPVTENAGQDVAWHRVTDEVPPIRSHTMHRGWEVAKVGVDAQEIDKLLYRQVGRYLSWS
jgi:hypothetical protein